MNNEYTQSFSRQLNQKEKLLTITALSGEFPYSCFGRLNFDENYARRLRSMLYKDGSIRSQWKDGLKGLVLTFEYLTAAKEKKQPDTSMLKSKADRRQADGTANIFSL